MEVGHASDVSMGKVQKMLAAAMEAHGAGRSAEAEAGYLAVLEQNYRPVDVLPLLAGLATDRSDFDVALDRWTRLLELQPRNVFGLMQKGTLHHRRGQWQQAAESLEAARAIDPRHPVVLSNLGVVLTDAGRKEEALKVFQDLAKVKPGDPAVEHQIRRTASAIVPFWHIPMLNDAPRNDAFERAIIQAIEQKGADALVLDIGAGSGLLSMMAARAGAKQVVCCESVDTISDLTAEIVTANGYADRIKVVRKKSDQLHVPEDLERPADILISEILSSDLLSEYVVATFEDALARLTREDATIIPRRVTAKGCLIASEALAQYAFVNEVSGFDVSRFTTLASQRLPVHGSDTAWRRLTCDHDLLTIDLTARRHEPKTEILSLPVTASGTAVGVMQWLAIDLAENVFFENPPDTYADGGWLQVLHTFPRPISVSAGEIFKLVAGHDRTSLILVPAGHDA